MKKSILLATAAVVALNVTAPAFAETKYSWEDTIAKAMAFELETGRKGGWVRGAHTNKSFKALHGNSGYVFGNVLGNDVILPYITDITAISAAAKEASKPIIVASTEWILPSNPMLCEVASQAGMTCGSFTELFYRNSTLDAEGNVDVNGSIVKLETLQAQVVSYVESMQLSVESNNSDLITSLVEVVEVLEVDTDMNAETIALLEAQIEALEANQVISEESIAQLNYDLDLKVKYQIALSAALTDEKAKNAYLQGDYDAALVTISELEDRLVIANARLTQAFHVAQTEQKVLNTEITELEATITSIEGMLEAVKASKALLQTNFDDQSKTLSDLLVTHSAVVAQVNGLIGQVKDLGEKLNTVTNDLNTVTLNSEAAVESFNTALGVYGFEATTTDLYKQIPLAIAHISGLWSDTLAELAEAKQSVVILEAEKAQFVKALAKANTDHAADIEALNDKFDAKVAELVAANMTITNLNISIDELNEDLEIANGYTQSAVDAFNTNAEAYGFSASKTDLYKEIPALIAHISGLWSADKIALTNALEDVSNLNVQLAGTKEALAKTIVDRDYYYGLIFDDSGYLADISDLEADVKGLKKELQTADNKIISLNNEVESLTNSLGLAQAAAKSFEASYDKYFDLYTEANTSIFNLSSAIDAVKVEIADVHSSLTNASGVLTSGSSVTIDFQGKSYTITAEAQAQVVSDFVSVDFSDIAGPNNQAAALISAVDAIEVNQVISVSAFVGDTKADWSHYSDYEMFSFGGTFIKTEDGFVKVEDHKQVAGSLVEGNDYSDGQLSANSVDVFDNNSNGNGSVTTLTKSHSGVDFGFELGYAKFRHDNTSTDLYGNGNVVFTLESNAYHFSLKSDDSNVALQFSGSTPSALAADLGLLESDGSGWTTLFGHINTLVADVAEAAYDQGFGEGYEVGFTDGFNTGYDQGFADGVEGNYNK